MGLLGSLCGFPRGGGTTLTTRPAATQRVSAPMLPFSNAPLGPRAISCRGGIVNVLGIVHAKDLLRRSLSGEPFDLLSLLKTPLFIPETATAMKLLAMFKKNGRHVAFVLDEYGDVQGLVLIGCVPGSPGQGAACP